VTNAWTYDAAGNVKTASGKFGTAQATVNDDNELTEWTQGVQQMTVLGQVQPGPNNSKWFGSTASAQGHSAPVSMQDGSFGIAGVPVNSGQNLLTAIVQDVSGNTATQTVNFAVGNSPSATFSYDLNGNLSSVSSASSVLNYSYDAENRLVKVVSNSVTVLECWYDGAGHRIAKEEIIGTQTNTVQYVWDGWKLMAVLAADGQLQEFYMRGVGVDRDIGSLVAATHYISGSPPATYYLHNNHRGDVILARQGTNTVATLEYAPYGELRSYSGTYTPRFRFSSKDYDACTKWYYFLSRYYAPQWARWMNRDLIDERGGINLYQYVRNQPLHYTDSFGLDKPGCDLVGSVPGEVGDYFKKPCPLECCALHDKCYDDWGCSAWSWFGYAKDACIKCNQLVVKCLKDCKPHPDYDDPCRPNYYDAKKHKFFD
jgi:RHS repeat-associated protein